MLNVAYEEVGSHSRKRQQQDSGGERDFSWLKIYSRGRFEWIVHKAGSR